MWSPQGERPEQEAGGRNLPGMRGESGEVVFPVPVRKCSHEMFFPFSGKALVTALSKVEECFFLIATAPKAGRRT